MFNFENKKKKSWVIFQAKKIKKCQVLFVLYLLSLVSLHQFVEYCISSCTRKRRGKTRNNILKLIVSWELGFYRKSTRKICVSHLGSKLPRYT